MGPKMDSLLYAILGSDRQILKSVKARSVHACSLISNACFPASSPSFLLLPLSNGRLPHPSWRDEKPRLRSWELEPNPTAIREKRTERKTALETTGSTIRRLRGIKIRC